VETFATNGLLRLPRIAPSVATQILTGSRRPSASVSAHGPVVPTLTVPFTVSV
jgi:hypothetical protein